MNDLISRQVAIDAINDLPNCPNGYSDTYDKACIIGTLEGAPTADVPERKVGEWTERKVIEDGKAIEEWQSAKCSVCGKYHTTPYMYYFYNFNYCPSCGARMKGEDDG